MRTSLLLALVTACAAEPPPLPCGGLLSDAPGPRDAAALEVILTDVRTTMYPDLQGVSITLGTLDSEQDYFVSSLDFATASLDGRDRAYVVKANPKLLADPPSRGVVAAILAHELKHTVDFVAMGSEELATFGLWYASTDDPSKYERETDEQALRLGCGPGLKGYREWLYPRVDDATRARKIRDYYTPAEIDAWIAAHP